VSKPIRVLVALDDGVHRDAVQDALPLAADIQIIGLVEGIDEAWLTLQETPTDLLMVACAGYSDKALYLVDAAVKQQPERPVIVLCEGSPQGFIRRVFEMGADDLLALPETPDQIRFSMQKAVARKQGAALSSIAGPAPLVCVLGPKGGTGKTLTATNLAVALAEAGERTALLDLDLQFGDVGLCLGLAPERTIYDLVKAGGSLDGDKLDGYLTLHESGVRVLLAPSRPDQASAVTVEFLREVYAIMRASNDYVIVDTPPGFTPEVIASVDASSDVCLVGMLDSLSLKNTKLGLETLDLMGYKPDRVRIVLNRADSRVGITGEDVSAIVGRTPDVLVPSDREIPRAINEGVPIVTHKSHSEAAKAFRALAQQYRTAQVSSMNGQMAPPETSSLRRLLARKA
jgi:pilus assembly protein CpaE